MPLTSAAGCISLVEQTLADTLAACAVWQGLVGAASASEAAKSIHFAALPRAAAGADSHTRDELEALRPFAILFTDEECGFRRRAVDHNSDGFGYSDSGVVKFLIEANVSDDDAEDPAEAERKFKNLCGNLIDQMAELAGQAGYLAATEITFLGPYRGNPDEVSAQGDYYVGFFTLQYSEQGR